MTRDGRQEGAGRRHEEDDVLMAVDEQSRRIRKLRETHGDGEEEGPQGGEDSESKLVTDTVVRVASVVVLA